MNKVKIITDSCSDMGKDLRGQYDIDYVRMSVNWSGEEKPASTDWDIYTVKEFYDAMRSGIRITTNQVAVSEFENVFGKYLDDGYDIVYVACSSALSGSYNVGQVVAKNLEEKYSGHKIVCVDPKNSCGGELLVALKAAELAAQGLDAVAIGERLKEYSVNVLQFCTADSLTYLKRAGRVKASAAFFGNLFGIKPIIISNAAGENEAVKKVKGTKNAHDECVNLLKAAIEKGPGVRADRYSRSRRLSRSREIPCRQSKGAYRPEGNIHKHHRSYYRRVGRPGRSSRIRCGRSVCQVVLYYNILNI